MKSRLSSVLLPALLALLLAPPTAHAQEDVDPIVATDLLRIRELDDVTLSPDHRNVAYTVRRAVEDPDDEEAYVYRTQLFMASASGRDEPHQLTFGPAGASQPDWHPEGDTLAFVRPVDGTPQVFVLPLYGGEAYQVTDAEHGAAQPRWSPDGDRILYASPLPERTVHEQMQRGPAWPHERPGRTFDDAADAGADPTGSLAQIRAWLAQNADADAPRVIHRLDFQGEHGLEPSRTYRHLFVIDAETGAEPQAVTSGYHSFGSGAWLPDGRRIVVSGHMQDDRHPDRSLDSDLFIAYVDGRTPEPLLDLEGHAVFDPQVAPGGEYVAFRARPTDDAGYAQIELGVLPLDEAGDEGERLLTHSFDRSVAETRWAPDGWHLYFTAASDGGYPLFRVSAFPKRAPQAVDRADSLSAVLKAAALEQGADSLDAEALIAPEALDADTMAAADTTSATAAAGVQRLTSYGQGIRSFDVGDASVFFVLTDPANPYELHTAGLDAGRTRPLTTHNTEWIEDRRLSTLDADTLMRDDGTAVPYWVMKPATFEEGRTYPLMLQIHGGPMAMWGPGEATMWHEFQFFASQGYGIVFANPRGSGGYGESFQRANYQDWGEGPASDVLTVAEEAVATREWLDTGRQVVTGGSYAGYLTAWIVAHDDRFRAAVAQRGVYDLDTFLGEGNAWRLVPSHFGGYPWETLESAEAEETGDMRTLLTHQSPLTYADQIDTPLLIMHADEDLRTGVAQSEMLYRALKILDRPVEYVRYPDSGHDLSRTGDPHLRIDRLLRIYEFFARYVDEPVPAETAAATSRR